MPIPSEIEGFLCLIKFGRVDNTYKMVWARAIVDLCTEKPDRDSIPLDAIAEKVIGYYWNLHIFFDPDGRTLMQGTNRNKPPLILQYILGLINSYKSFKEHYKPIFYEQLRTSEKEQLSIRLDKVVKILKTDVRHRFLNLSNSTKNIDIYDYTAEDDKLIFTEDACTQIAEYQDVLYQSILFRWTQILEDLNRATPRVASKLKISRKEINRRRGSLIKYHEWLKIENPDIVCAICSKPIEENKLSVDHVIPWSFLYSDDIWNLCFVHKGCNSSKSNIPPSNDMISEQEARNKRLFKTIKKEVEYQDKIDNKIFKELDFSSEENLLRRMWQMYKR